MALSCSLVAVLTGCTGLPAPVRSPDPGATAGPSSPTAAPTPRISAAPRSPQPAAERTAFPECFEKHEVVEQFPLTMDRLESYTSTQIVVADVISATGPSIFNTRDGTEPPPRPDLPRNIWSATTSLLTPVRLDVIETLAGDADLGTLRATVEGGALGCIVHTVKPTPDLVVGRRYLVMLIPGFDEDETARPDRPRVDAAWPISSDGLVDTEADGAMPLEELRAIVSAWPARSWR